MKGRKMRKKEGIVDQPSFSSPSSPSSLSRLPELNLAVDFAGIKMKNPVMVASGTFGYGEEFMEIFDVNQLGAIVVKGTTLEPRWGNPLPRIVETPSGMINSIGLQNVGVEGFIREKLPMFKRLGIVTPIIVNISGHSIEEFEEVARRLDGAGGIQGLELNISCPNIAYASARTFSHDPATTREVTARVRKVTRLPLIVKLSPDVTDIVAIAQAAVEGGADALAIMNTIPGMAIDAETRRAKIARGVGGLSGPAIKPIALRLIWTVFQAVKVPIVGMGGIMNGTDAIEFFIAGSKTVAVGTANFVNPKASVEVVDGIQAYLRRHGLNHTNELVGSLIIPAVTPHSAIRIPQ